MKPRRRGLVLDPHPYVDAGDTAPDTCRYRVGDRVCGLPENNRHHQEQKPRGPVDDERQLRLDIDG